MQYEKIDLQKSGRVALFVIILLGAFLRLYRLDFQGIWFDEAHTWLMASRGLLCLWKEQVLSSSPPLYFSFMHYWIRFLGKHAFIIRLPSALSGILTIPLVYIIAKKMFDKKTALISSLLVAFSSPHIYYSQEARCYMMLAASALLSGFCFYRMLLQENNRTRTAYIVSTLVCLYLHNYGIFIWLAQLLYLFFKGYLKNYKMVIAELAIFLLYIPRLIIFSQQIYMDMNAWIMKPNLINLIQTIAHLGILSRNMPIFPLIAIIATINLILFTFIFFLAIRTAKERSDKFPLLICVLHFVFPIGASFLISFIKPMYIPGKYDFITYLFFILIIGKGISCLHKKKILYTVLTFILASSFVCNYNYFYIYRKSNNLLINKFIKERVRYDDVIIFTNLAILTYHYYFDGDTHRYVFSYPEGDNLPCHPKEAIEEREDFADDQIAKISRKLLPIIDNNRRLFLFYSSMEIDRMLVRYLKEGLYLEEEISFPERRWDKFEIMRVMIFRKSRQAG